MDRLTASMILSEQDLAALQEPPARRVPASRRLCDSLWMAGIFTTVIAVALGAFTPLAVGMSGFLLMWVAVTAALVGSVAVVTDLWLTERHQRQLKAAGIPALDALASECLTPAKAPQYRVCMVADGELTHIRLICTDIRATTGTWRQCLEERSFRGGETEVMNQLIEYREELEDQAREYNHQARQDYLCSVQQIAQAGQMRELLSQV